MAYDPANVRRTNYDLTWDEAPNAHDLGGLDDVTPDLQLVYSPVKIGSAGPLKLDDFFDGLGDGAKITGVVREVTVARIRKLCPWDNGSGAVDLTPPVGVKVYQYAKRLLLHPRDKGAATDEDIVFFKTFPMSSFQLKRNGVLVDLWEVSFAIYPDRTKLAAGVSAYGEILGA